MSYSSHFKNTPQRESLPFKDMVKNEAGGYVFAIDDWARLKRFLVIGNEGGTFYETERKLTLDNAACIRRCLQADGKRTVETIVEVSHGGLAPKNDAAVFALAVATKLGNDETRKLAFAALPKVARIGTHLFQFTEAREAIGGGWGRAMRKAISEWYDRPDRVMQTLKYQQREGWAHRDLLRLSHAKDTTGVFDAVGKPYPKHAKRSEPKSWKEIPEAEGYLKVQAAQTAKEAAALIAQYKLPREYVPTQFLTEAPVWDALLPHMPLGALVRNLGNLSKSGLLVPLSDAAKLVSSKLADEAQIKKSRLHPFAIMLASKVYASGKSVKGSGTWKAVPQVITALDSAFDLAFHNVEPTGKRFLLAVDVSGSMWHPQYNPGRVIMPSECAAVIALATARVEPNYYTMAFSTKFQDVGITAQDTIPTTLKKITNMEFGGTDTSVAINWARQYKIPVDVFVILTDNATWAGQTHTCQALQQYRQALGIPAKLAVVAFTATGNSIADKDDAGSMDFVGMDASLPQALAAFVNE